MSSNGRRKYWCKQISETVPVQEIVENNGHIMHWIFSNYLYANMIISTIPWRAILRVPLNLINVRHLIYLYIYKFYNYIHGKYIWNRSVMLTNNACFMKRNIAVKHSYDKESLHNNEKHCGFDTLRLRRMEYV